MTITSEEARFREAVPASMQAVNAFAVYLQRKGLEVVINQVKVRPRYEERVGYGDTEDIKARYPDKEWKRFEVKGLGVAFTSREDWPYRAVFADRANKTSPRADWYISLSKDLCHAVVVDGAMHEHWQRLDIFDKVKGYTFPVYACPLELARFIRIAP